MNPTKAECHYFVNCHILLATVGGVPRLSQSVKQYFNNNVSLTCFGESHIYLLASVNEYTIITKLGEAHTKW